MKRLKWWVTYDGDQTSGVHTIEADNERDALRQIIDCHSYPFDDDEEFHTASILEMWKHVMDTNGDGCDYILSVISQKSGVLFRCDEPIIRRETD